MSVDLRQVSDIGRGRAQSRCEGQGTTAMCRAFLKQESPATLNP
jgi:hypothetical protein